MVVGHPDRPEVLAGDVEHVAEVAHFPGALYLVLDRQKSLVVVLGSTLALRVPALILGAHLAGMTGAMEALTASAFLNMFVWNGFIPPVLEVRFRDLLRTTWRSIVSCAVMAVIVAWAAADLPVSLPALLRFVIAVLAGAASLILTQFSIWTAVGRPETAERMAINLAGKIVRRIGWAGQGA